LAKSPPTDEPQNAILLLQRTAFDEGEILDISTRFHAWKPIEFNDIYYRYTGQMHDIEKYPAFKATLIWPAGNRDRKKAPPPKISAFHFGIFEFTLKVCLLLAYRQV